MSHEEPKESTIGDTLLLLAIVVLLALIGNMMLGCVDVPTYDPVAFCSAECHLSHQQGVIRVDTPGGLYTCNCKDIH